jgi:predicted Zn-dependent peptidase
MTVVMVGDVTEKDAVQLMVDTFENFAVRSECPPTIIEDDPPLVEIRRQDLQIPRLGQGRLMMAWTGPGIDCLEDGLGLDLLSAVLAGGRCSRLVQELREEKQLVLDIQSSFSLQRNSSLLSVTAWLEPQHLALVEQLIRDRIYEMQTKPISEVELARAKRLLCHDYIFSTETPGQLAGLYGYYHTLASAELATRYPTTIQAIDCHTLQRLARQYLSPDYYAITAMQPLE